MISVFEMKLLEVEVEEEAKEQKNL